MTFIQTFLFIINGFLQYILEATLGFTEEIVERSIFIILKLTKENVLLHMALK